jgi:hypothetical protein
LAAFPDPAAIAAKLEPAAISADSSNILARILHLFVDLITPIYRRRPAAATYPRNQFAMSKDPPNLALAMHLPYAFSSWSWRGIDAGDDVPQPSL